MEILSREATKELRGSKYEFYNPRSRSGEDYQRDMDSGKYDSFRQSDVGGIYTYQTTPNGVTLIKDAEPADNDKGHQKQIYYLKTVILHEFILIMIDMASINQESV